MKWVFLGLLVPGLLMLGLGWMCERTSTGPGHAADEGIICAAPYLIGVFLLAVDGVVMIAWAIVKVLLT